MWCLQEMPHLDTATAIALLQVLSTTRYLVYQNQPFLPSMTRVEFNNKRWAPLCYRTVCLAPNHCTAATKTPRYLQVDWLSPWKRRTTPSEGATPCPTLQKPTNDMGDDMGDVLLGIKLRWRVHRTTEVLKVYPLSAETFYSQWRCSP